MPFWDWFWVNNEGNDSAKRSFEIVSSLKHVLHFPLRKFWFLVEGDTLLTFYPMIVYRVLQTSVVTREGIMHK
jgi:hypothetical protein